MSNLALICITVFVLKNLIKLKKFDENYNNYPWPKYFSFDKGNKPIKHNKIFINDEEYYLFAKGLCMYTSIICNNTKPPDNLSIKKYLEYKVYYLKK